MQDAKPLEDASMILDELSKRGGFGVLQANPGSCTLVWFLSLFLGSLSRTPWDGFAKKHEFGADGCRVRMPSSAAEGREMVNALIGECRGDSSRKTWRALSFPRFAVTPLSNRIRLGSRLDLQLRWKEGNAADS